MFIAEWVQLGIDLAASDLHFAAGERPRAKINGSWEWLSDRECPPRPTVRFCAGNCKSARAGIVGGT
ncbi:hypothetical protein H1164_00520 [Thermoactinomyces daqus]|uniref:Uncharacterized protein n=1 Tax=Thermoactinomyces daqus TaxID=1329516 RepID=A0A7W2AG90_9BACL|nr:hypothetical protein [Thermoactinomyces daqus]MBA4541396.1 hypothetical protein [Thermoactinomyces daqus]